jgi:hypothetical protein
MIDHRYDQSLLLNDFGIICVEIDFFDKLSFIEKNDHL